MQHYRQWVTSGANPLAKRAEFDQLCDSLLWTIALIKNEVGQAMASKRYAKPEILTVATWYELYTENSNQIHNPSLGYRKLLTKWQRAKEAKE